MKNLMIALAFAGFISAPALAQDVEIPVKKYSVATNSFWANWFISGGITGNAFYTSQEASNVKGNPFSEKRGTIGMTVAIGKWFTPGIGLRTKVDFFKGRALYSNEHYPVYNYVDVHEDVMFNLSNLLCGYNEKRIWNFIPYLGVGFARNCSDHNNDISHHFGILNTFRVSNRFQIFADVNVAACEGSFDRSSENLPDAWSHASKHSLRHWDKKVALELGVTYNMGKHTWDKTPDVESLMAMNREQMDALNQSLQEQQDENTRLRQLLTDAQKKEPVVVENDSKEFVGTSSSVFFNINSAKVASRKDLVNVKELAEYAKENDAKIIVTGYADSKTGTAEYNQNLSEKRAQTVADELVKMGVDSDNIIIEAKGGVENLAPFSYNRRATVKIQK